MQVYDSPYKTCTECARSVYNKEGARAFYRSFYTQLAMNIPFQSIHFMAYEACQDFLNTDREYHPLTHCMSGALAGAAAAACTTPLDVAKTLLNTQERLTVCKVDHGRIEGLQQAVRTIYLCCGTKGFFRGLSARVIYQMPSTALSWSVYEFFKHFILQRRAAEHDGYVSPSGVHAVAKETATAQKPQTSISMTASPMSLQLLPQLDASDKNKPHHTMPSGIKGETPTNLLRDGAPLVKAT